jgi:hypothetical protein
MLNLHTLLQLVFIRDYSVDLLLVIYYKNVILINKFGICTGIVTPPALLFSLISEIGNYIKKLLSCHVKLLIQVYPF